MMKESDYRPVDKGCSPLGCPVSIMVGGVPFPAWLCGNAVGTLAIEIQTDVPDGPVYVSRDVEGKLIGALAQCDGLIKTDGEFNYYRLAPDLSTNCQEVAWHQILTSMLRHAA